MSKTSDLIRNHNIGKVGHIGDDVIIPENIEIKKDMQYGSDNVWNLFDIYYEKSNNKIHPTVISIHGGGWVSNTKESYEIYCLDMASRGFNVVNFTFRLAPEHTHPAMIEDVNSLLTHLVERKMAYSLDMDNVFMIGDSAGAHILSMYMGICTNPEYAKTFSLQVPKGFLPKGIALNCGVYDIKREIDMDSTGMITEIIYDYMGTEKRDEVLVQINTIDFVTVDYPPVYLMTSNDDIFQTQYTIMLDKLEILRVKNIHKIYGTKHNLLGHVFHLDVFSKDARDCNNDECNFFQSCLE